MHDPHRDATTLPMIPRVVESGMPLFAVCRGFQEMNVAYGGTLWQKVQDLPGMLDHREDKQRRSKCSTRRPTRWNSCRAESCAAWQAPIASW